MFLVTSWCLPVPGNAEEVSNRLELRGEYQQGGLVFGTAPAGSRVVFDGSAVRVSPDGHFLIGFHRDEPAEVELVVTFPGGAVDRRTLEVASREYDIQRVEGVPQRTVTPPPEALERIRREGAAIARTRKRDDPRTDFLTDWQWPATGRISGVYGSQRVYNGVPKRPHFGVDVARPTGTPVYAPAGGVVSFAHADTYYSGGLIVLDHGHGLSSSFLHLSEVLVEYGRRVEQGDLIGKIGATGRASGPHLDWRMNLFQRRIDPQLLVGPMPAR